MSEEFTGLTIMEQTSSFELMQALSFDELFTYSFVDVAISEIKSREVYEAKVYHVKEEMEEQSTLLEVQTITAHSPEAGRELRKIFKNPQSALAAIINYRSSTEEEWKSELLLKYYPGDQKKGIMDFTQEIIQKTIDCGRFHSMADVNAMLEEYRVMLIDKDREFLKMEEFKKRYNIQ